MTGIEEPACAVTTGDAPIVEVSASCGRLRGRCVDSVRVFLGIPYGAPPVRAARFAPPSPATPFTGTFDALCFGTISPQDVDPLPQAVPGAENLYYAPDTVTGEDCLNLNVWAPEGAVSAPVLLYIHGGGYLCGSGTGPWCQGAAQAHAHGLVVVTVNYRLGLLGGMFLGDQETGGSCLALQDQILALQWVRENIAGFGGDPGNVTIAGESAGGMSVSALLFAPAAEGLFRRAIVESGNIDNTLSTGQAIDARSRVLDELAIPPGAPDLLERLREVSLLRILAVQRRLGLGPWVIPLVDDGIVLAGIAATQMPAWARDVDLLLGTNAEENRLFTITGWGGEPAAPEQTIAAMLSDSVDRATALGLYAEEPDLRDDPTSVSHRIISDRAWSAPVRRLALAHEGAAGHTYLYRWAWRSDALNGRVGAAHVVEIPFFYGNLSARGVDELLGDRIYGADTRDLERRMSATVAQFAATGELADCPLGEWPDFRDAHRATMVIDLDPRVELDYQSQRLDFWAEHPASLIDSLAVTGAA